MRYGYVRCRVSDLVFHVYGISIIALQICNKIQQFELAMSMN